MSSITETQPQKVDQSSCGTHEKIFLVSMITALALMIIGLLACYGVGAFAQVSKHKLIGSICIASCALLVIATGPALKCLGMKPTPKGREVTIAGMKQFSPAFTPTGHKIPFSMTPKQLRSHLFGKAGGKGLHISLRPFKGSPKVIHVHKLDQNKSITAQVAAYREFTQYAKHEQAWNFEVRTSDQLNRDIV